MNRTNDLRQHYDNSDTTADLENAEYEPADAPPAAERMTTFAVRLPVPVLDRVRQIAAEQGVTTSEVLRRWVDDGITAHDHTAELGSVPASELLDLIARHGNDPASRSA